MCICTNITDRLSGVANIVRVFKDIFNNISVISWWLVLLVEETAVL